jgi:uncharacterized membrane protein
MTIALLFHILAAVIWVGGMFFAHVMLRPAVAPLDPPVRLALFRRVLGNFFPWVWASVIALLASGYGVLMPNTGGFAHAPLYVNIMQIIGIVMMLAFFHLYFAPWKRFRRAADAAEWPKAAANLAQIRNLVLCNLVLGLIVVVVGGTGRYWS